MDNPVLAGVLAGVLVLLAAGAIWFITNYWPMLAVAGVFWLLLRIWWLLQLRRVWRIWMVRLKVMRAEVEMEAAYSQVKAEIDRQRNHRHEGRSPMARPSMRWSCRD